MCVYVFKKYFQKQKKKKNPTMSFLAWKPNDTLAFVMDRLSNSTKSRSHFVKVNLIF